MGYQQILTIASIFLLSTLILNVHSATTERLTTMYSNESVIAASGIAQSIIDELQTKGFDERTLYKMVTTTDSLTLSLGKDSGESLSIQFDDIDDYNFYTRIDSLNRMGRFDTKVLVYYIDKNSPDTKSSTRTFTKRVDVHITNFSFPDTLKFHHIIGY
jgi:flagellin-specific chaperone FliS